MMMTLRSCAITVCTTMAIAALISQPAAARDCPAYPGTITGLAKVTDGDTIRLQTDSGAVRVRLYGVDAPERRDWPWGPRATRRMVDTVQPATPVTCVWRDTDKYCRFVGWCDQGDRTLNLVLIRSGNATVYGRFLKDPIDQVGRRLLAAEQQAIKDRRGVWADDQR